MDPTTQAMDDGLEEPRLPGEEDSEGDLPPDLPGDDPLPPELLAMTAEDLVPLGERLVRLAQEAEELEEKVKEKNKEWEQVSRRMVELMESVGENGMRNFVVEGVARFQLDPKMKVSVLAKDKDELIKWLKADENRKALVKEEANPSRLKALVKEMQRKNEPIPDFFKVYRYTEIKSVAVKKKGA